MKLAHSFSLGDWATSLAFVNDTAYCSTADGQIAEFSAAKMTNVQTKKVHDSTISKLVVSETEPNMLFSCSNDATVKVFDPRKGLEPVSVLKNARNLPFFSLDVSNAGLIASGSELKQQDVELSIWDVRKLQQPCRSLIDGHNDDITAVKFHPTRPNVLLSGSTDGCVNLYDLNIVEEDDALLQSINHTSVHSANFLTPDRLFVLTHMETLSLFDVASEDDMDPDSKVHSKLNDKDLGDLRERWACDYVVDIKAPNYVITGSYEAKSLKVATFSNEFDALDNVRELAGAHGEEVVRDVCVRGGIVWSAGEDSCVRVWTQDQDMSTLADTRRNFVVSSEPAQEALETEPMDLEFKPPREPSTRDKTHRKEKKTRKNRFAPY